MSPSERSQAGCQRPLTFSPDQLPPSPWTNTKQLQWFSQLPLSLPSTTCPEKTLKNRKQTMALPYRNPCNALGQSCDKYPAVDASGPAHSGPAHLSSPSMHHSPVISHFSHSGLLLLPGMHKIPQHLRDGAHLHFLCPEVNAHTLALPSKAHICLVTCRPKLKCHMGSRLGQSSYSTLIFSFTAPATVYNPTFLWLFNLHFFLSLDHQKLHEGGHCSFC